MNTAALKLHAWSRPRIETEPLAGPSAVVRMADAPALLANTKDTANVAARLDLVFNDARDDFGLVRAAMRRTWSPRSRWWCG